MSTHTPGPWILHEVGDVKRLCPATSDNTSILTVVYEDGIAFAAAYDASDARLIAAAPDMLAALREVVGALRVDKSIVRNPAFESDDVAWLLERIDAALAKADPTQ